VPPVATGRAEAMNHHQGGVVAITEHTPMALVFFPVPEAVLTPLGPCRGRLGLSEGAGGNGAGRHDGSGGTQRGDRRSF
jgi:hypothetical protein